MHFIPGQAYGSALTKIDNKIAVHKDRLQRLTLDHEREALSSLTIHFNNGSFAEEVEEMLRMTGKTANLPQSAVAAENPQVMRVRQHFEKKNKKYTQEREHLAVRLSTLIFTFSSPLQRKIDELQQRRQKLSDQAANGNLPSGNVLTNVGHNLKAVGGTIADYTG